METFSFRERSLALERMSASGVDVLVIGGGITGCAAALDAATRGYRVGLVEKSDFASGASSKSTKLVHGGIRYLPQFDFSMVHEALVERELLFRNAPWIVKPLSFILPVYSWNKRPLGAPIVPPFGIGMDLVVQSGLLAYDIFAGARNVHRHRRLTLPQARAGAPALRAEGMKYAFAYYDGETDDVRLTMAVLRTACVKGAQAANYAEATGFEIEDGAVAAANVLDRMSGRTMTIAARHVVNATGVFADRVESLTGQPSSVRVEPAKGVHLVFERSKIPMTDHAVVLPETEDDRLLFLVPWDRFVLAGTTDTVESDIETPQTTQEDVDYLLSQCNRYLKTPLTARDIVSCYAGYRPLIKPRSSDAESSKLSRTHAVVNGPAGIVTIVGGKLTTWRKMAEDTIDALAARDGNPTPCRTRNLPLDGSDGWQEARDEAADLPDDVRRRLSGFYGSRMRAIVALMREEPDLAAPITPGSSCTMAEAVYAVRREMALSLDDVLCRRTRVVLEDPDQGLAAAKTVASRMGVELDWDCEEVRRQIAAYQQTVQRNYRVVSE